MEPIQTGSIEQDTQRPVIEDVLEETAAARAEIEASPPSERDMDFEAADSDSGAEPSPGGEGSGGGEFGTEDQRRRRRRRRGRGRGPNGQAEAPGYTSQPVQNSRAPRPRTGQPERRSGPHGQHRRPDSGPRGPHTPRPQSSEPRGSEPRGPEVLTPVQGILELHPKGYGFLRDPKAGYVSQESDSFVSGSLIEKHGLREGVLITGEYVSGGRGQGPRLKSVQTIEGRKLVIGRQHDFFPQLMRRRGNILARRFDHQYHRPKTDEIRP